VTGSSTDEIGVAGARKPSDLRVETSDDAVHSASPSELGALLADLRTAKGRSLRQVGEASDRVGFEPELEPARERQDPEVVA
jgi:hypothetical protein